MSGAFVCFIHIKDKTKNKRKRNTSFTLKCKVEDIDLGVIHIVLVYSIWTQAKVINYTQIENNGQCKKIL